ncbi:MAG: family 16 glycoside hydrolase, partial [Terriglobia bacterium]
MRKALLLVGSCVGLAMLLTIMITTQPFAAPQETQQQWGPNDRNRPEPPIITPGTASTQMHAGVPPSDAVVLFNGKDLSNWEEVKGGSAKWTVGKGYFAVLPGTGDIRTKATYGDCQLHVEWATPNPPHGKDQDR